MNVALEKTAACRIQHPAGHLQMVSSGNCTSLSMPPYMCASQDGVLCPSSDKIPLPEEVQAAARIHLAFVHGSRLGSTGLAHQQRILAYIRYY